MVLRTLEERQKAGVEIRIIGKADKGLAAVETRKLAGLRLHVRAIIRDGSGAFIGSQSLRKLELDGRREVGVIVTDRRTAKKIQSVFEAGLGRERAASPRNGKADAEGYSCFRRSMMPESMTAPRREIALK